MSITYKHHDRVAYTNTTAPWITYEQRKHTRLPSLYVVEARDAGVRIYQGAHTVDDYGNLLRIENNNLVAHSLRDGAGLSNEAMH